MDLNVAIKELRTRQGLSQQAFATHMGLAIRSVARYEAGGEPRTAVVHQFIHEAKRIGFTDVAESLEAYLHRLLDKWSACVELAKGCISYAIDDLEGNQPNRTRKMTPEELVQTLREAVEWLEEATTKHKDDTE